MWTFKCYTSLRSKNEIKEWYESLDDKLRAKVYSVVEYLKNSEKPLWRPPPADKQSGGDLYEIRISYKKNQYRIIGYFVDEKKEFVMCCHFQKKGKADNRKGFERAEERRKKIEQGDGKTEEYDFVPDEAAGEAASE